MLLGAGRGEDGRPRQVVCERDAAGAWEAGIGADEPGWASTEGDSDDAGVLTWWQEAPEGATAAVVRVGDRLAEVPVSAGYALHAEWDAPVDEADWPELVRFV